MVSKSLVKSSSSEFNFKKIASMDVVKMAKKRHKIQEARHRVDVDKAFLEDVAMAKRRDTACQSAF